jgi:hypothetical protein
MNILIRLLKASLLMIACIAAAPALPAADDVPKATSQIVPADQAREHVSKKCTVELMVKASKNAVPRKVYFLDSKEDFHDEQNFCVLISYDHVARFQEAGIENPAEHYKGKTIRVTGTVIEEDDQIRMRIDDPKQVTIVEPSATKPK